MPIGVGQHAILGTPRPAIEASLGIYAHGVVRIPNKINESFMVVTNGRPVVTPQTSFRDASGKLGAATVLAVPVDPDVLNIAPGEHRVGGRIGKLLAEQSGGLGAKIYSEWPTIDAYKDEQNIDALHEILPIIFIETSENLNAKEKADSALPTVPSPPEQPGIVVYRRKDLYMMAEQTWLNLALAKVQTQISKILDSGSTYPTMRIVGYGNVRKTNGNLELVRRPSHYIDYMDNSIAQIGMEFDPFPRALKRDYCVLLSILALQLSKLVPFKSGDKGWTLEDYMALANVLLFEFFGSGDTDFGRPYDIADIIERVSGFIGFGISAADEFLPIVDSELGQELWEEWIYFAVLFGIIGTRIKALTMPIVLRSVKGSIYTAAGYFEYTLEPEYSKNRKTPIAGGMAPPATPGWAGSLSVPWLPMARNTMYEDLPFPCLLEPDTWKVNEVVHNQHKRVAVPQAEFQGIESRMGRIDTPLAAYELKEIHIKYTVHTDTIHYLASFKERNIMYWEIPYTRNDMSEENMGNINRSFMYLLGLMTGNPNTLEGGWTIKPVIGLKQPVVIDTSINQWKEPTVTKQSDTRTEVPQMSAPGEIPSAKLPNETPTSNEGLSSPVAQQQPLPEQVGPSAPVGVINAKPKES